ncbi:MAG: hypothetical protein AABY22_03410 [Nanoarchaeota archaeon]
MEWKDCNHNIKQITDFSSINVDLSECCDVCIQYWFIMNRYKQCDLCWEYTLNFKSEKNWLYCLKCIAKNNFGYNASQRITYDNSKK